MNTTNKPFMIEKRRVYEAYKAVKSAKGAAGVDGQTIEQFESDLKGNLYKIWNRMSSGTYFPPPGADKLTNPPYDHQTKRCLRTETSPRWPAAPGVMFSRIHRA